MTHETRVASLHAEAVLAKIRRRFAGTNPSFRPEEIEGLGRDLGFRSTVDPQINAAEWLADQLAGVGWMPFQRSSVLDLAAPPLRRRNGQVVALTPGAEYVAKALNEGFRRLGWNRA